MPLLIPIPSTRTPSDFLEIAWAELVILNSPPPQSIPHSWSLHNGKLPMNQDSGITKNFIPSRDVNKICDLCSVVESCQLRVKTGVNLWVRWGDTMYMWRVLNLGEPEKHERMCKLVDGDVLAKVPAISTYHTTTHQTHHTCLPVHKEGFPQHCFQPLRQTKW